MATRETTMRGCDPDEGAGIAYLYMIVLVAAVGGFLFGYDLSLISGAVIFSRRSCALAVLVRRGYRQRHPGLPVRPAGGRMAGRSLRAENERSSFVALVHGIDDRQCGAGGIIEFIIWRFVGGMGVGLASTVSPMYIAEVAPARLRGRLVVVNQLAIVIGLSLSVFVTYLLSFGGHWRWMFATQGVPVVCLMAGLLFVPESPRWLATVGRSRRGPWRCWRRSTAERRRKRR